MHAIKHINNACFSLFHSVTTSNEDDNYDSCKIGKIHQELQIDSNCCEPLLQFLCKFTKQ